MVSDFVALCIMEDEIDVSEDGISEEVETLVIVFVIDTDGEVRTSAMDVVADSIVFCFVEDKIDVSEDGISEEVETLIIVFVTDTDGEVRTSDSD